MIRRLAPADLPQIERHWRALSTRDRLHRFHLPLADPAIRARVAAIDWSSTVILGSFDGRKLRGMVELAELRGDGVHRREVAISVLRAQRRRGIGRKLLAEAARRAQALGCRRLVFVWHPENDGFARFLAACGGTVMTHPPAGWLDVGAPCADSRHAYILGKAVRLATPSARLDRGA